MVSTGVRTDMIRAGSDIGGGLRDELSKVMSPSEIEQAEKLARECPAKNYKGC